MGITKLKEPRPRKKTGRAFPHAFRFEGAITLPPVKRHKLPRLDLVLNSRRSRRDFDLPLTTQELGDLLWYSARTKERQVMRNKIWESRTAPSGGGCHPIQIGLLRAPGAEKLAMIYDGQYHICGVVSEEDANLGQCFQEIARCLPVGRGTICWFFCDMGRLDWKYQNPESLAWRDSGALLATISLVAEAMGLQSCAMGIHETKCLRRVFKLPATVVGMGGCVIAGG